MLSFSFLFSTTMQYVIYTYMKHLGVRVKEPRSLESKRVRINFLPKIKVLNINLCTLPISFSSLSVIYLTRLVFLIKCRKASRQKRKEKRRSRNPDFPASSDLSVDPAALKQHQVSDDSRKSQGSDTTSKYFEILTLLFAPIFSG